MWPRTFGERLTQWSELRHRCSLLPLPDALAEINRWWFDSPWIPYHLHWDDQPTWPDPWQLLEDNLYCSLARGLGIMYTITLLDRPDLQDARLTELGSDNLVLVDSGKYILNWDRDTIVNINLDSQKSRHHLEQQQLKLQIK